MVKRHVTVCFQLPWLLLLTSKVLIFCVTISIENAPFIRLQVPIRQMLDRNEDMRTTGTRHPCLGRYKVDKYYNFTT